MKKIRNINFESDFKLIEGFKNGSSITNAPFRFTYYVRMNKGTYVAEFDGVNYTNCMPNGDGRILVPFDGVRLGLGVLLVKREFYLNDADFKDGICHLTSSDMSTGVILVKGPSDDLEDITVEYAVPYIMRSGGAGGGGEILPGSINEFHLSNNAVTESKIKDGAVTKEKLADDVKALLGASVLDAEMPIGNTTLGDAILSVSDDHELFAHLDKTSTPAKLKVGTPYSAIFSALLYREAEIVEPEIEDQRGSIANVKGVVTFKFTSDKTRPRPGDWINVEITYTPESPTTTDTYVSGMEYGYKSESGAIIGDKSIVKNAVIGTQSGVSIKSVVHAGGAEVIHVDGNTYKFQAKKGSNKIVATVDEGTRECYIDGIHVWPLNSANKAFVEVDIERLEVDLTGETTGDDTYAIADAYQPVLSTTDAGVQLSGGKIEYDSFDIPPCGQSKSFSIRPTYATCESTKPKIAWTNASRNFGYVTSKGSKDVLKQDSIEGTVNIAQEAGSIIVKHVVDGQEETLTPEDGVYTFTSREGHNKIIAKLTQPLFTCNADAITVYPLDEDGEISSNFSDGATAKGLSNHQVGGDKAYIEKTLSEGNVVLPAILIMAAYDDPSDVILNTELQYAESGFDITDNENKEQYANLTTTEGATDYPWTVLIPKSRENATIAVWKWNRTKWTKAAAEFELKDENYIHTDGETYRKYFSEDNTLTKADMCVKVII